MALVLALIVGTFLLPGATASAQERGEFEDGVSAEDIVEEAKVNRLGFVFEQIGSATNAGLENLIPVLNTLLASLLIISLVLTFLFGAFQEGFDPLFTLLKKAILVGFILFFIGEWKDLRDAVLDGAAQIGIIAGNTDLDTGSVLNPAAVAGRGFTLALAILARIVDLSGPIAFFTNFAFIWMYLISATIILIAFGILSITVFVAMVEFYIGTTVAVILFPLAVLRTTSFAAQSAFGYVIASAVKIIVLGLIIGLATSIFIDPLLALDLAPLQGEAMGIAFICLAIAVVAWSASSIAAGLVQGGPALGAGAAVGPVISAAAGAALAAGGAGLAARAAGGLAGQSAGASAGGGSSISGSLSGPPKTPMLPGGGGGGSPLLLTGPSTPAAITKGSTAPLGSGEGFTTSGSPYNSPLPVKAGQASGAGSSGFSTSGGSYHSPLPAVAGQSLPATTAASSSQAGSSSATGSPTHLGPGASPGGASAARASMGRPSPPPAGEGNGGRGGGGSGQSIKPAAAYAATLAVMADRGGSGYQGPNLDED